VDIMSKQLYEVFARHKREDPLGHIGTVRATSDAFARVYARNTYDEENWAELVVVPREAIIPVLELELLLDPNG
jgi:1,2-phenylacetyl-CoA epoxidase PaaB subunit